MSQYDLNYWCGNPEDDEDDDVFIIKDETRGMCYIVAPYGRFSVIHNELGLSNQEMRDIYQAWKVENDHI